VTQTVQIRQDGAKVLIIKNGVLIFELPWEAALALADGIRAKGKLAEEYAKANQIISDQAILMRAGAPFALTNNPDILSEARKTAETDRNLRRYIPASIPSGERFGVPTVILGPPKG
jgi:hypothetical protein